MSKKWTTTIDLKNTVPLKKRTVYCVYSNFTILVKDRNVKETEHRTSFVLILAALTNMYKLLT